MTMFRPLALVIARALPIVALLVGGVAWAQDVPLAPALMPMPSQVRMDEGVLPLAGDFQWQGSGMHDAFVAHAAARFEVDVHRLTGVEPGGQGPVVRVVCCTHAAKPGALALADESYHLVVGKTDVVLSADTPVGVLRGLATLRQLVMPGRQGAGIRLADIQDTPRFAWRGLMIDVARHYQPLPALKRQIDAMELTKLNVLHLHLSDNEGFRFQSSLYPKLTQAAGDAFYTRQQLMELVSYAQERGVMVVPEVDLPGHAAAIVAAYPEYAAGPVPQAAVGGAALDVTKPATYVFVDRLLGELASVFPAPYIHLGGDEVNGKDWMANKDIQAFMQSHGMTTPQALQEYFFLKANALLARHGRHAIGWEEVASGDTPKDVIVQAWRSSNAIDGATRRGNPVIVSAGYYLDYLLPASAHYAVDPLDAAAAGIDPDIYAKIEQHFRLLLPYFSQGDVKHPGLALDESQKQKVLGGEAVLWTELVTGEMLDGRVWPRMASIAERFWSPASTTDVTDMYRRLVRVQDELRVLGLDDDANRQRMLARMAPGGSDTLTILVDALAPVRNFAHMHKLIDFVHHRPPGIQSFNQFADAAFPDGVVADAFNLAAGDVAQGDETQVEAVQARLAQWQGSHARVLALSQRYPGIQPLVPVSARVSELAATGMEAINAIHAHHVPDPQWLAHAQALLSQEDAAVQASSSLFATIITPTQPDQDLLIAIAPGVRQLVDAAAHAH